MRLDKPSTDLRRRLSVQSREEPRVPVALSPVRGLEGAGATNRSETAKRRQHHGSYGVNRAYRWVLPTFP